MTTLNTNLATKASTTLTNYSFDSFCRAPDGKYYGIRADGLYLLEGATDDTAEIAWSVGLGKVNFGSRALKLLPVAYAGVSGANLTELVVTTEGGESYIYPARACSESLKTQRFDLGKGLRENYYNLTLQGVGAATLDDFEILDIKSKRSIQS